jgi:hypothetical protein
MSEAAKETSKAVRDAVGRGSMQLIIAVYVPFVVQMLWNWFAAPALHLDSISYSNMFGLLLIVNVVMIRNSAISEAHHIQRVITLLEACLPEDRRAEALRAVDEGLEGKFLRPAVAVILRRGRNRVSGRGLGGIRCLGRILGCPCRSRWDHNARPRSSRTSRSGDGCRPVPF